MQDALNTSEAGVEPSEDALRLAEEVVSATDLQRDILEEAAASGTESGRTVCGEATDAKEPLSRSFGSVTLQGCSLDNIALMHGGGGHDIDAPVHSLMDIGNVLFGRSDASIVVGSSRSDVFLSPDDKYTDGVAREFQSAVGAPVESADDIYEAYEDGKIDDPSGARQRFRDAFPGLFQTVETRHPGISRGALAAAPVDITTAVDRGFNASKERSQNISVALRALPLPAIKFDLDNVEFNLAQMIASQFVDALVLAGFFYVLGGTPRQLLRG